MQIREIIERIPCETCVEERTFGFPPNNNADNKYVYIDLSGATRCFCKKHASYYKEGSPGLLNFDDEWDYPCFGAKLISEVLSTNPKEDEGSYHYLFTLAAIGKHNLF